VVKKDEAQTVDTKSKLDPVSFFKETRDELDKVVWLSRQQLVSESLAVLLMVILSASLIYLVDNLFTWIARQVFGG
jgi:preprotein translocase subunit SecE